ncbi:MAG: hypothetical protein RID53_25775 [Coleofasciculus sp. B1-GNL1-01]
MTRRNGLQAGWLNTSASLLPRERDRSTQPTPAFSPKLYRKLP